jgi:hypothetical protein
MMTYPDCELCACKLDSADTDTPNSQAFELLASYFGQGALIEPTISSSYTNPPLNNTQCETPEDRKLIQMGLILSGYDNGSQDNKYEDIYGGSGEDSDDFVEWYKSPVYPLFQPDGEIKNWKCSPQPSWAQKLNQMNNRGNFWGASEGNNNIYTNITTAIETTLINNQFPDIDGTSDPLLDNAFIMITDASTNLIPGDVIVFNNPTDTTKLRDNNVNNPNVVTNTTFNENNYVTATVKGLSRDYVNNNNLVTYKNIKIFNTGSTSEYKYHSGVEYFQVITAMTNSEVLSLMNGSTGVNDWQYSNLLNYYIYSTHQKYGCSNDTSDNDPDYSTGGLANKYGLSNFKITFMVRGVDLHTPKQKIRYDLSKIFGYQGSGLDNFTGDVVVEGNYYLNIPIQSNVPYDGWYDNDDNLLIKNKWRDDFEVNGQRIPSPHFIRRFKDGGWGSNNENDYTFIDNYGNFSVQFIDLAGQYEQMDTPNLYHKSFTLSIVDGFETVLSRIPSYYVALDGSFGGTNGDGYTKLNQYDNYMGQGTDTDNQTTGNFIQNIFVNKGIRGQGVIAGCGYQYSKTGTNREVNGRKDIISVSPLYLPKSMDLYSDLLLNETDFNIPTAHLNGDEIVFRSDRIPSGDVVDFPNPDELESGNNLNDSCFRRYGLHMNGAFTIYTVEESGIENLGNVNLDLQSFDESFNFQDEYEDISGTTLGNAISSFTCEGMKPFDCYDGICDTFEVQNPCTEVEGVFGLTNITGEERVVNGCYVFLVKAPLFSLFLDLKMLVEYRARLRFNYALCNGILNQSFFNNWVSGSLYLPSFQVNRIFSAEGDVKKYKYCGSPDFNVESLTYQGPIYYNTDTNSFYYRSTPFLDFNDSFIGQVPKRNYNGANSKNIWFPTTITELGPKDKFSSEISLTSEFQGYIMDKIKTTTYNDPSDIINLFAISRLTNSSLFAQLSNTGDASVDNLFSRDNKYVDGDYAQLVSINSEFGVIPFLEGNYEDSQLTFCEYDDGKPVIGIWFDSDVISRRIFGEGTETIGTNVLGLTSNFGYPNSQTIPYYKWTVNVVGNNNLNLFGTEFNDWHTGNIYKSKHQGTEFFSDSTNTYMYPDNLYGLGYIFNREADGDPLNQLPSNTFNINSTYKHGSPFHFYFGLKRGKSAINKYIRKYILFE